MKTIQVKVEGEWRKVLNPRVLEGKFLDYCVEDIRLIEQEPTEKPDKHFYWYCEEDGLWSKNGVKCPDCKKYQPTEEKTPKCKVKPINNKIELPLIISHSYKGVFDSYGECIATDDMTKWMNQITKKVNELVDYINSNNK